MENKGFLATLFDLSFGEFVTTRVIKVLFILGVVFSGIGAFMVILAGFRGGALTGIVALLLSPVVFFLYVLGTRIWCEIIVVLFRIAENTGKIANRPQS